MNRSASRIIRGILAETLVVPLADAAKKGVGVVRSTRAGSGLVVRNVEVDDDKLGLIAATPTKATRPSIETGRQGAIDGMQEEREGRGSHDLFSIDST